MSRASPNSNVRARVTASAVDMAVGAALDLALSSTVGLWFARRAVVTLRIGEPGTWWQGPVPMILGAFGEVVYLLPFALLVAGLLEPLTVATIGQRAMGLRMSDTSGRLATRARLALRTAILYVGPWGVTLALVARRWEIGALALAGAAMVAAGSLGALGHAGLTLHDRLTGTRADRRR